MRAKQINNALKAAAQTTSKFRGEIHKNEIDAYNRLLNQYENISSSIFWEEMQSLDNYVKNIRRIATKIDVDVDLDMVATLWTKWKIETDKCLNNKTKQTYSTNVE